ncbi:MAG: hypothetical protein ACF8XB_08465 [Planctomycetota bacterium JB042]
MLSPRAENERSIAGASVGTLLQTARTAASGLLAGGVVHEFANLLTVVDGMRQMAALAPDSPPKLTLLDQPADRCGAIVEAFRHFFGERGDRVEASTARLELTSLGELLRAFLRGHAARVDVQEAGAELPVDGRLGATLRPVILCVVLGRLERARAAEATPSRVGLAAERDADGGVAFVAHLGGGDALASLGPVEGAPGDDASLGERVEAVGRELAAALGGEVEDVPSTRPPGRRLRVRVPA